MQIKLCVCSQRTHSANLIAATENDSINMGIKDVRRIVFKHHTTNIKPYVLVFTDQKRHLRFFVGYIVVEAIFGRIIKSKCVWRDSDALENFNPFH